MKRFRFSLLTLMALVAIAAAALANASELWASAAFTVTIAVLSASVLGILFARSQSNRVFCTGLAVIGWIYLVMAFTPWFRSSGNPGPPPLVTTKLLDLAQQSAVDSSAGQASQNANDGPIIVYLSQIQTPQPATPSRKHFQQVGHSLLALVLGFVGGVVARWLHGRRQKGGEPDGSD